MYTCFCCCFCFFFTTASVADEDAVYLHEIVVQAHDIYKRLQSLLLFTHEQRNDHECSALWPQLRVSGIALPRLFVRWLAIQGSLESAGCYCLCHLRNSQTQSQQIDTSANLDTCKSI